MAKPAQTEHQIWCLFSISMQYHDQPDNNLVAWWKVKPSFEVLLAAMDGSMEREECILAAANVFQENSQGSTNFDTLSYSLERVTEGKHL